MLFRIRRTSCVVTRMADYHALIAKAVSALERDTEAARQQLYERARAAFTAAMHRADPPLSEADFLDARMSLEEAIGKVEAEARRNGGGRRPMATKSASLPGGEPPSGEASGETSAGQGGWLSEVLARASREDDEALGPSRRQRRKR
jgi:hypothetical protein